MEIPRGYCMLCYTKINKDSIIGEKIIITQCFHDFHEQCFIYKLKMDNKEFGSCPYCCMNLYIPVKYIYRSKEIIKQLKLSSAPKQIKMV